MAMLPTMRCISRSSLRRTPAATVVLAALLVAGCGAETGQGDDPTASESQSGSPSASASEDSGATGRGTDAECGGGELETRVLEAAEGVQLTVPAEWRSKSFGRGADVRLYGQDQDADDGQVVVDNEGKDFERAVAALEELNAYSEKTGERDLRLEGFEAARMLVYADDDAFTVNVVAVTEDGLRAIAYWIQEDAPAQQPVIESCLSTLRRSTAG